MKAMFRLGSDRLLSLVGRHAGFTSVVVVMVLVSLAAEVAQASWNIQQVDAPVAGGSTSLAFDAAGNPAMSYLDSNTMSLKFARWNGTSWQSEVIDMAGINLGDRETSLAFDGAGHAVIAYVGNGGGVKLARWTGASWQIEWVDSADGGQGVCLAFDSQGNPAVGYNTSSADLRFARWTGSSWQIEVVDSDGTVGRFNSLAFDRAGNPAISYGIYSFAEGHKLKFAHWDGTSWQIEIVDQSGDVGRYTSLVFDGAGNPVIGYRDLGKPALKLARWNGTSWQIEFVAYAGGEWASLALDGAGNPAISYQGYAAGARDLRLARWDGATWQIEVVDTSGDVGSFSSLAFDPAGNPAIGYYDATASGPGPRYASLLASGTIYRGSVAALTLDWQSAALPLTSLNDDQTQPFPVAVTVPGAALDALSASEALVLYRFLGPGDTDTSNALKAVKLPAGVELSF